MTQDVQFSSLIGEHVLDAVDTWNERIASEYSDEDCSLISFRLDGKVYTACENPDDGYRSSMEYLRRSDHKMKNEFPPCRVLVRQKPNEKYISNDTLELIDIETGLVVLEVGTDNSDDYYPRFVANFNPENMKANTP